MKGYEGMKLSVSAWSVQELLFPKKTNLVEFIDFCKKNKVDAVELLDCFWENDEQVGKIKAYLDSIGMPVSCYSVGNDFVKDEKGRQEEIAAVKKGIDIAVQLGTDRVRVFSGDVVEGISFEQGKSYIIESLKECAAYAEKKGVTLVLENHGKFAGKGSQVKEIIETVGSKALRANTDTGNFLLVCENPLDAIKALNGLVGYVHFKDFTKASGQGQYQAVDGTGYNGTVIGAGYVQLKEIVDFLYSANYDGYLSIEFEGDGEPYAGALASIEFAKSIIK